MLDPRQIFRLLHEEEVAAVLVGGVVMIVHGVARVTNDKRVHSPCQAVR